MKIHKLALSVFASVCVSTLLMMITSCEARVIEPKDLPETILSYVAQHFPGDEFTYIERDGAGAGLEYEVHLSSGAKLEFDRKGRPNSLKSYKGLPHSVIPLGILDYLTREHAGAKIVEWERDEDRPNHQEVTIIDASHTRLELTFTKDGHYIGTDFD